jgi:hypothetical protein
VAKFGFDVSEVEVSAPAEYDPIPEGDYILKAVDAEEKETSRGDGTYIKVKFEVAKGEHAGRLLWQNFNIVNPSEKAQRIGRQQLVAWATACGKPNVDDTDKLLGKPFGASVAIEPGKNGYKASNRIKVFLFDQAADTPAPAKKVPPAAKAPPVAKAAMAAKGANPWDE